MKLSATAVLTDGVYNIEVVDENSGVAFQRMRFDADRLPQILDSGMLGVVLGEIPEELFFATTAALKDAGANIPAEYLAD